MSVTNFVHSAAPSIPIMPPLPQFVGQDLPAQHEEFRHSMPFFPQSSCGKELIGGTLASMLTKNPIPMLLGLCQCVTRVFAQQKVGSEFLVNTYTTLHQVDPSIASFGNGNFVVIWRSFEQDGSSHGVFGHLFNENGTKIGSEFQANSYTTSAQWFPSVASFSNSNFVVTWSSDGQDGSGYGVYGQLFDGNTTKIGNEFQINTYSTLDQQYPAVAIFGNDNFVVTWESDGQDGSSFGVYGQIFNGTGFKIGDEFPVNTYTNGYQKKPSVATFIKGNFLVTWQSFGQDGSGDGVYGQLFDGTGAKIGREFQVNTYTVGGQYYPSVITFGNSNFIVVWERGISISGQLFDANGTKIGNEFQVNTYTISSFSYPSVTTFGNDNFVVTWANDRQVSSTYEVFGRLFNNEGTKIGIEFQVNTYVRRNQWFPSVAIVSNGNFVVTWQSDRQDGSAYGIYGQIFNDVLLSSTTSTTSTTSLSLSSTTSTTSTTSSISSSTTSTTSTTSSISSSTTSTTSSRSSSKTSATSTTSSIAQKRTSVNLSNQEIPPTTSDSNHRFAWIWFLLGGIGTISFLGMLGYLFQRTRAKQKNKKLLFELQQIDGGFHQTSPRETTEYYQKTPDEVTAGGREVYQKTPDEVTADEVRLYEKMPSVMPGEIEGFYEKMP